MEKLHLHWQRLFPSATNDMLTGQGSSRKYTWRNAYRRKEINSTMLDEATCALFLANALGKKWILLSLPQRAMVILNLAKQPVEEKETQFWNAHHKHEIVFSFFTGGVKLNSNNWVFTLREYPAIKHVVYSIIRLRVDFCKGFRNLFVSLKWCSFFMTGTLFGVKFSVLCNWVKRKKKKTLFSSFLCFMLRVLTSYHFIIGCKYTITTYHLTKYRRWTGHFYHSEDCRKYITSK